MRPAVAAFAIHAQASYDCRGTEHAATTLKGWGFVSRIKIFEKVTAAYTECA